LMSSSAEAHKVPYEATPAEREAARRILAVERDHHPPRGSRSVSKAKPT
jgi:hypothetical protein